MSCAQAVLLEAIDDAGFEGELLQEADSTAITLRVEGMTCSSCSSAVETALHNQKGVVSAAVNLLAKRAEVQCAVVCKCTSLHCLAEVQHVCCMYKYICEHDCTFVGMS